MASLFVSHSSKDDAIATTLEEWLKSNGFTDIFIDHENISGGEKWRDALRSSAAACRVVLCLVTTNWLASYECFSEFGAAWYMGKRVVPLLLITRDALLNEEAQSRLRRVLDEYQGLDLTACLKADGALDLSFHQGLVVRLKLSLREAGALSNIGLTPEAFAVDMRLKPTPFPGLASFGDDDADAALFYGRSKEIAQVLEELRKVRAERDLRPFVILGSSGAGKSSLLKAGIIPRLRRETPAWLPLRAFRPGPYPLLRFSEAISRTLIEFEHAEAPGVIRDQLLAKWRQALRDDNGGFAASGISILEEALEEVGARLRRLAAREKATILISVDQAEEMIRAQGEESEALADYLRIALGMTKSHWQLAFTIRTDSFPELQRHRRFQNLEARGYDLRALPVFRFESVVEEPAKRYAVEVDDNLVGALIEDAPKDDSLPLLAFALQRLWSQYAASGSLSKQHYEKVGGIQGLIEDAAERAIRGIDPSEYISLPPSTPTKTQIELAARTFVPSLAEVNDHGAVIRHIATWSSFDSEQQDLLERFIRWRLVVRKKDKDADSVEVAHEALFRTWKRLEAWLEPERLRLEALRSLQVDAGNWLRNGKDSSFLNHRRNRLSNVRSLSLDPRYNRRLQTQDRDYLDACAAADEAAQAKARRNKVLLGSLTALLMLAGFGWWKRDLIREQYGWRFVMQPNILSSFQEKSLAAATGSRFRECAKGCPEMVVVPAGSFRMGTPEGEGDKREHPEHIVEIPVPFAIGTHELTFDEWDACSAYGTCPNVTDANGWGRGDQPMIHVTWNAAQEYVRWLSSVTGKRYRLPSEAEWEYAARGEISGSNTKSSSFSFGDDDKKLYLYGWYNLNSDDHTHPVGLLKPNAFSLYDMHGNVSEWVEDCWHEDYKNKPKELNENGAAWIDTNCNRRSIRGGAWLYHSFYLRSASRDWMYRDQEKNTIGFRIVREIQR